MQPADAALSPRREARGLARATAGMLALGATLGTALDGIHSHFGATRYTSPVFWLAAAWVPPLFAGAFALGALRPLVAPREAPPPSSHALGAMGLFVAAYWASVLPLAWPAVSGLLFAMFVVSYLAFDRTRVGLAVCVGGAFGGPAFEAVLVRAGAFEHTAPVFAGVSGWLPFLYLTAGVGLQTSARWLAGR